MKYTITITQAHIDEAVKRNQFNLAAQEQIKLRITLDNIYSKETQKSYKATC